MIPFEYISVLIVPFGSDIFRSRKYSHLKRILLQLLSTFSGKKSCFHSTGRLFPSACFFFFYNILIPLMEIELFLKETKHLKQILFPVRLFHSLFVEFTVTFQGRDIVHTNKLTWSSWCVKQHISIDCASLISQSGTVVSRRRMVLETAVPDWPTKPARCEGCRYATVLAIIITVIHNTPWKLLLLFLLAVRRIHLKF